ncbi:MAG: helix-turn-helix transcriptional regulator [Nocardioidaceae bacterium]
MSARKSERLMNLVIALLVTRHYLSKDRVRAIVEGYHEQSDEAFERMFERDKEELREIGIEIEVGTNDKAFDDEPGYRIRRDAVELPEISLEPDEAAVVGLAARVWQHASLARQTSSAVVKLKAAGLPVERAALGLVEPQLAAGEPAFEPLWDALVTRTPVTFDYARPGHAATTRTIEPWGVVSWHGRWYVTGHDRDRQAVRMFRLSRVVGPVSPAGAPGSYTIPDGTDLRELAQELMPAAPVGTARVQVRQDAGHALRRRATSVAPASAGWDVVEVPYASTYALAEELTGFAADVVVEAPDALRASVIDRLTRLSEGAA